MTAVATIPANAITQMIGNRVQELGRSAYKGFSPDVVVEMALHAAAVNPAILKCSPQSVFVSLTKVARWGLAIGDGVHLVPYGTECTAVPDYKGLKALAYRQGLCRLIQEYPVYEGDHFKIRHGLPSNIEHTPCDPSARGSLIGAWILIHLPAGMMAFHHMHIADIEEIRAKSQQWGPRKIPACPPWYATKTVVRNWLNRQPKNGAAGGSSSLAEALDADEVDFEIVGATSAESGAAAPRPAELPGTEANFGGYGGTPVALAPKGVLEQFATWCHEKSERAERYQVQLGIAEDRLVSMAASRDDADLPL